MKTIILAGGKGTRIRSVRDDVPKPMIEILGKPILQYQVENLKASGLTDITIGVGWLGDVIKNSFGDGSRLGVSISYFTEAQPLGTAGALFRMLDGRDLRSVATETVLDDDFLLLCGDILFDVDFAPFIRFHMESGAWATLAAHPNSHPQDSSLLMTEGENGGRVVRWVSKEDDHTGCRNLVNAGIQIISPALLRETLARLEASTSGLPEKLDLDRDVLRPAVPSGKIFAYHTAEYIKDMGTPERYREAEADIRSRIPGGCQVQHNEIPHGTI